VSLNLPATSNPLKCSMQEAAPVEISRICGQILRFIPRSKDSSETRCSRNGGYHHKCRRIERAPSPFHLTRLLYPPSPSPISYTIYTQLKHPTTHYLLRQQLPRRRLHPQLRIQPMRKLDVPRHRLRVLPVSRRIHKYTLQVESCRLCLLVRRDFHREEAVARSLFGIEGGIAASYNNLPREPY